MLQHHDYLKQALDLAATRRGYCAPNPAVGAVVVKNGTVIGQGVHYACGMPHAEAAALKSLGAHAADATLYVTLEPCCHYGRTPPCTKAIIESKINNVIYGYKDPNPIVAGKGHRHLLEAGIESLHMALPEIDAFYKSYSYWQKEKRPWVTAKIAMSLDGKIAGAQGERIAITGPELKADTYLARQKSDAILTSAKTVIQDNPMLDVRLDSRRESKPLYILDRTLQLSSNYQIWQNTKKRTVFYSSSITTKPPNALVEQGVLFVPILEQAGRLDLAAILDYIGIDGVHDLWVEAGGTLLESMLLQGFVHSLHVYCAPKWLGKEAQSAFTYHPLCFDQFSEKIWRQRGDDVVCAMERKLG